MTWTPVVIDAAVHLDGSDQQQACIAGGIVAGAADATADGFFVAISQSGNTPWSVYEMVGPTYAATRLGGDLAFGFDNEGPGSLAIVDGELWFAWTEGLQGAPYVQKYDPGTDSWGPVGDGGGTGSQLDPSDGDASRPILAGGYVFFAAGGTNPYVYQWQDPDWVGVDLAEIEDFQCRFSVVSLIVDPGTGFPVYAGCPAPGGAPATGVRRFTGVTWETLGGDAIPDFDPTNIDSADNSNQIWLLAHPGVPGRYALVSTDWGPTVGSVGPKVAFWNGGPDWTAPVEADPTSAALFFGDTGFANPNGGSAWADADRIYCAVLYRGGTGAEVNVQVVTIPWGGSAWAPWPGVPQANSVMAADSPLAPDFDYSSPVMAFTAGGRAGLVVGDEADDVYRFWTWSSSGIALHAHLRLS